MSKLEINMTTNLDFHGYEAITELLKPHYLKAAISGKSSEMKPIFHNDATWYGNVGLDLIAGPIQSLYDWHDDDGTTTDLVYNISKIDIIGKIASVRIELDNWNSSRFTDFLNLLKVDGK